jgi:hypothetical protein
LPLGLRTAYGKPSSPPRVHELCASIYPFSGSCTSSHTSVSHTHCIFYLLLYCCGVPLPDDESLPPTARSFLSAHVLHCYPFHSIRLVLHSCLVLP